VSGYTGQRSKSDGFLAKRFVLVDVICFISQMAGAGVQVSTSTSLQKIGAKIVLGGLNFQVLTFAFFVDVAWRFHVRLNRNLIVLRVLW